MMMALHIGAFVLYTGILCIQPIYEDKFCNVKKGYYPSFFVMAFMQCLSLLLLAVIFFNFSSPGITQRY
jgi:hypothetical protein